MKCKLKPSFISSIISKDEKFPLFYICSFGKHLMNELFPTSTKPNNNKYLFFNKSTLFK